MNPGPALPLASQHHTPPFPPPGPGVGAVLTHLSCRVREDIAPPTATRAATTAPARAGTASGLIRSIEPASYILREIVSQAEDILRHRPQKLLGG